MVHMLKAIKHLSMNSTLLEVLQNANAIEILTKILEEQKSGPYSTVRSGLLLPLLHHTSPKPVIHLYLSCRKWRITSSKPATTSVDSTNPDKKKLRRPASFPVSCALSSPSHRSSSSRCLYSVTSRVQVRAAGCFYGSMMGWRCIFAYWRIRTSK